VTNQSICVEFATMKLTGNILNFNVLKEWFKLRRSRIGRHHPYFFGNQKIAALITWLSVWEGNIFNELFDQQSLQFLYQKHWR